MNKSQKKFVRQVKESIERSQENRFKSRGLPPPSQVHGATTPPRSNRVPVSAGKIDVDEYLDYE